jgi:hypothetical protein
MDQPVEKYLLAAVAWLALVTAIALWMNRGRS